MFVCLSFSLPRPTESLRQERPASASSSSPQCYSIGPAQSNSSPSQSNTPVTRRERHRNGDRQRAHSTATLAASVGLPCPLSPPGAPGNANPDWHTNESLANLDAITFPGMLQNSGGDSYGGSMETGTITTSGDDGIGRGAAGFSSSQEGQGVSLCDTENVEKERRLHLQIGQSASDTMPSGDTLKDLPRERSFSVETAEGGCAEVAGLVSPKTPSPQPPAPSQQEDQEHLSSPPSSSLPSTRQHLSSLRISESSLSTQIGQSGFTELSVSPWQAMDPASGQSQEDFDEVFLQEPAPPLTPPPIRETDITDDFPPPPSFLPPPPPPTLEQGDHHGQQRKDRYVQVPPLS